MHNSSSSPTASPADLAHPQRSIAELVEILIYSLCLLIGGPLNLFSFRKLLNHQLSRPNANRPPFGAQIALLKLHLNIADLITMFIYTLSQIVWMISYQWHAGDLLCRICKFFHTFGFYLNSFVVACFAIDRFFGTRNLNNPSGTSIAHRRAKRMLLIAWTLATLLSVPQCFIFRVFEPSELSNFKQCTPIWTILGYELDIELGALRRGDEGAELGESVNEQRRRELIGQFEEVLKWERAYNLTHLLFVFWIPSLIIVASYASILITLNSLSVVPQSIRRTGASFRQCRSVRKSDDNHKNKQEENNNGNEEEKEKMNTNFCHFHQQNEVEKRENGKEMWGGIGGRQRGEEITSLAKRGEERRPERRKSGGGGVGALAAQTIAKARQNTKRQAAMILAAYLTFWTPYNLLAIINAFASKEGSVREIFSITLPFLNSLIVVNPIVNPLIYGVFECGRNF